jgi:hypothetical protein
MSEESKWKIPSAMPEARYPAALMPVISVALPEAVPSGHLDDDLIEVTDEELLKKLRSIKGQYFTGEVPVFYYDLLSGRPCDSSVHRTGILNLPSGKYGIIEDELNSEQIFSLTARCTNCRYMRIAHNPDDQKYAWYRRKGMCERFKEPPAEENEARRKEWFPNRTK